MVDSWKNHELGTPTDKVVADSSPGNTPNNPVFIQPICTDWPIIWDIIKKGTYPTINSELNCAD